jgi:hypothetical protein
MPGYVFHCSSCGFPHAGDCIKPAPLPPDEQAELEEGLKEATLDELKTAYLALKNELFRRLGQP